MVTASSLLTCESYLFAESVWSSQAVPPVSNFGPHEGAGFPDLRRSPQVFLSFSCSCMCGVRRSRYRRSDQRPRARMPPASGYTWETSGHAGEGACGPGDMQVRGVVSVCV